MQSTNMAKWQIILVGLLILSLSLIFAKKLLVVQQSHPMKTDALTITSPAFANGEIIPQKYTCQGDDINPPLRWSNIPAGTKSLVLIVDDPDAPMGTWTHWLVWNINPHIQTIHENEVPAGAILGTNDFQKQAYGGPCPPSGTHRYFFRLYALDIQLNLPAGATRSELETAMKDHLITQGELMGRYRQQ